jgi:hypothetical protein
MISLRLRRRNGREQERTIFCRLVVVAIESTLGLESLNSMCCQSTFLLDPILSANRAHQTMLRRFDIE